MLALAVVLIVTAFVVVACGPDAEAPTQSGTVVDIDTDRSKPRPKMTPPAPAAPKVVIPKQRSGGKR